MGPFISILHTTYGLKCVIVYSCGVDTESGVSHSQISISLYDSSFFEFTVSSPL